MDSKKINSSRYRILGVDPGTNILGYAILEVVSNHLRIIDFGVISLLKYADHTEKLKEIFLQLQEIIETYQPTQMAIESPFYGKNVQSMLKLGRAQGVSMAAGITMGLSIEEYAPKKVKLSITGNGNASKEQVASMLENILKIKIESKYLDSTDALGVAVCHFNQKGLIQNTVKKEGVKKKMDWSAFVKDNPTKVLKNK
ncbi:MAG: crossover junction endodeoxyribonuclease RuvC [Saprospiraceae bacterium]|nr:crossover junction endodeoxyribonuclease RuvC [Saprospiraceae bacterium]MBK8547301.1 crossover junction endodeoxyribonuclease RuvC [Saprospiraceae bacterium]MBK8852642.1 crossover junction endodeoxyribonuclease RuvC [Saprospiraceae bacterium]MBK9042290.1 crossover junction endodeoxyribonuclease RuvC [Saprospiraceae bacterium]MBP6693913.1 crossover junction endodeoxyribonuclease RuvC [Saprospiraceae bacterium]